MGDRKKGGEKIDKKNERGGRCNKNRRGESKSGLREGSGR